MISFVWNNVRFDLTNVGGGVLEGAIKRHAHAKDCYEFHFVTGGSGVLKTDDGEYPLENGSFFITGPGVYHSQISSETNPMRDVFFTLQAYDIKKRNAVSSVLLNTYFYFVQGVDTKIAKLILEEYTAKQPDYESALAGLVMKTMTDVTRLMLPKDFTLSNGHENLNDRRFVIIENTFLSERNITLTELSNRIGVCERQTERLLQKYYGKSFREIKREFNNN